MTITLGGGVSINCIYYTIFSKVLCLLFCQIPSPYQDSHMQMICGNPGPVYMEWTACTKCCEYFQLVANIEEGVGLLHACICSKVNYLQIFKQ